MKQLGKHVEISCENCTPPLVIRGRALDVASPQKWAGPADNCAVLLALYIKSIPRVLTGARLMVNVKAATKSDIDKGADRYTAASSGRRYPSSCENWHDTANKAPNATHKMQHAEITQDAAGDEV